jgi:hypothetical protein
LVIKKCKLQNNNNNNGGGGGDNGETLGLICKFPNTWVLRED